MKRRESIKAIGLISAGVFISGNAIAASENPDVPLALTWRIHPTNYSTDQQLKTFIDYIKKHKNAVNELALFDEVFPVGPCAPLEYVREISNIFKNRIPQLKKLVPRVGIDVLNTLGHGDRVGIWEIPYQVMIGHDGKEAACPCYNDEAFRSYIREKLSLLAKTNPDFIWLDDDFRVAHHGVRYPCFCPVCLEKFGETSSREALVSQLNHPDNDKLRNRWNAFCINSLNTLAEELQEVVANINPKIELGLMTIGYSNTTYGYDINSWMKELNSSMGRPGHGFYNDHQPREITGKIMDVGRQVRDYPDKVTSMQYELENWLYITLNKSVSTVLNESLMALMAGCNGVAYNIFYERDNHNLADNDQLLQGVSENVELWKKVNTLNQGLQPYGFWPMDSPQLFVNREVDNRGFFHDASDYNIQVPNDLAETGIPFSNSWKNSCGVLMSGRVAEAFSDEELRQMLSGAVYLDTQALGVLWERGLGELTGVKQVNESSIAVEIFADHPLNQGMAGTMRRASGWSQGTYLEKANNKVQAINHLHVMSSQERKGISLSLFENELGGRIAVSSYYPWDGLGMLAKVTQMSRLMNYLSQDNMPVKLEQPFRVMPLIRSSSDQNRFVLSLFNNSLDAYENVPVSVRSDASQVKLITHDGERNIKLKKEGDRLKMHIEKIEPWSVVVLHGNL